MSKNVVANLTMKAQRRLAAANWIPETVLPSKEREAKTLPTGLAELRVDVPLFAAELPELRIEAKPRITSTRKQTKPLSRNLKRFAVDVAASRIGSPRAPHAIPPRVGEVR